jgi:hypothetical protein
MTTNDIVKQKNGFVDYSGSYKPRHVKVSYLQEFIWKHFLTDV